MRADDEMTRLIETYDAAFAAEVEGVLRADPGFAEAALADLPAALRARFDVELAQPLALRREGDRFVLVSPATAPDELPDAMLELAGGGAGKGSGAKTGDFFSFEPRTRGSVSIA